MAKTINTNIDDGFLLFTFTNKQGEVFSSFKLNPTASTLQQERKNWKLSLNRLRNLLKMSLPVKRWRRLISRIEDKINYMLGYEASKDLFKEPITANNCFWKWSGVCL